MASQQKQQDQVTINEEAKIMSNCNADILTKGMKQDSDWEPYFQTQNPDFQSYPYKLQQ